MRVGLSHSTHITGQGEINRVSIALCTYNGERYLPQQLESFVRQTVQPYELVVCDDASRDSTVELLKAFAKNAPFPVHIHINPENLGISKNFEKAMQLCTGEFLALSDQDDVWLPRKIEILSGMLSHDPTLGGVFSDGDLIDSSSRRIGTTLWKRFGFGLWQRRKFRRDGATSVFITRVLVTGATLMLRRSALPLITPIPSGWVHDAWIGWMLAIYSKLSFATERLIHYRIHEAQQIGVGGLSLAERLKRATASGARDYLALAGELAILRDRILQLGLPPNDQIVRKLQGKIEHCRQCALLPQQPMRRVAAVLGQLGNYHRYSRPLRAIGRDILAGF